MSKLSIYETCWIDLVFQNRNKEYGAYKLRQESTKTSLIALFMGVTLLVGAISIPALVSIINPETAVTAIEPDLTNTLVKITDVYKNKTQPQKTQPTLKTKSQVNPVKSKALINPVIVPTAQADQNIAKNTDQPVVNTTPSDGTGTVAVNSPSTTVQSTVETPETGNPIINSVALDKLPEFPGGINKFYTYVGNNFEKQETELHGAVKIFVSFVIERDGSMTDIQVRRDPGYGLGKEAVRVLKSLRTKWTPGMISGKPVRTAYTLPITVQMN
jgi:protein TonB